MSRERRDVVAVGLTGGIGAGKTTALQLFEELGARTYSADRIVHDLYRQKGLATQVAARFGPHVLEESGAVDRARLAEAVRGRPDELRWLESLTHPRVAAKINRLVETASPGTVLVVEVPLLFEADLSGLFDVVVTVEAGPETRRRRSVHGFDLDLFSEFERLQASSEQRVAGSDLVFHNDGGLDSLRESVREAYEEARRLLTEER